MTTITCDYDNTITVDTDESSIKSGGVFITVSAYGAEHNVFLNAKKAVELRDALVALAPFAALATPKTKKRPHGAQEYKGNGKHGWEEVTGVTSRLRVPGGWLYETECSVVFVPVPAAVGYAV